MSNPENNLQPFLDIARLPGEPLLEGVPHKRSESLFTEQGLVDALQLTYATIGQRSKQRRITQDAILKDFETKKVDLGTLHSGLSNIGEYSNNTDLVRHASFMASIVADRLTKLHEKEEASQEPPIPLIPSTYDRMDSDVRRKILTIGSEQFDPDADYVNADRDPVARKLVASLVRNGDDQDPAILEAGALLFHRFNNPENDAAQGLWHFAMLAWGIDKVKRKTMGQKAPTNVSNQIIAAAGSAFVNAYPSPDGKTEVITSVINKTRSQSWLDHDWLMPKFDAITNQYAERRQLNWYVDRFMDGGHDAWRLENTPE